MGYSNPYLAPNGLTVITCGPTSCYSWDHDTAQFHPFHFADEAHLGWFPAAYSPDGEFFAHLKDRNIRVWDTRTGQLCGKPITVSRVDETALSPALNGRSRGHQLIALHDTIKKTTTVFDVHTGHLYAQFWDSGRPLAFIQDGTKLMSHYPVRIYDIADLAAKHRNATDGYGPVPRGMTDGWMVGQGNELLFWVPLEHRKVLCLPYVELPPVETVLGRATKVDLPNFKFGTQWTECIDQEWQKGLDERGKRVGRLLG